MERHAILVVGTGRCGTSAVTRVLQALGADLGPDLKAADASNPRGYFESTATTDLDKALLREIAVDWYATDPARVALVPATPARVARVGDHLGATFPTAPVFAVKDPRLCLLVPIYAAALRARGITPHCLRMRRSPEAVARSLVRMVGDDVRWPAMVRHHTALLDAAIIATGVDCVDVHYDDLVDHPRTIVRAIVERFTFLDPDRVVDAAQLVEPTLRTQI